MTDVGIEASFLSLDPMCPNQIVMLKLNMPIS